MMIGFVMGVTFFQGDLGLVASVGEHCRMAREHALLGYYEASLLYFEGMCSLGCRDCLAANLIVHFAVSVTLLTA